MLKCSSLSHLLVLFVSHLLTFSPSHLFFVAFIKYVISST